jgi:hypothetical protein
MAQTYKVLGQAAPGATTETDLYAVPASTRAVISSIVITERGGGTPTYRLSVSVGAAATTNKDYLVYGAALTANGYVTLTLGISLAATDTIRVYASDANVTFQVFGVEIT